MESELYRLGQGLREIMRGLQGVEPSGRSKGNGQIKWAQLVDRAGLPTLYAGDGAPRKHERGKVPPAGIDNMHLKTTDVFSIPGRGDYTVDFTGHFQVTRATPHNRDWDNQRMVFNYTHFKLFGVDSELGRITVDLNPDYVSGGETFVRDQNAKCVANTAVRFHLHDMDMTLFNKTPIVLKNEDMKGIPTIGEGSTIDTYHTALYDMQDPDGDPRAYLEQLQYTVLNYMEESEADAYQRSTSEHQFNELIAANGR